MDGWMGKLGLGVGRPCYGKSPFVRYLRYMALAKTHEDLAVFQKSIEAAMLVYAAYKTSRLGETGFRDSMAPVLQVRTRQPRRGLAQAVLPGAFQK